MQAAVDLATTYLASTGADESSSLLFDDEFHQAIGGVSNISVVQLLTMFQKVRDNIVATSSNWLRPWNFDVNDDGCCFFAG